MLQSGAPVPLWSPVHRQAAAALDAVVTRQAATIAYVDDFKLMMITAVIAAPLVLLIRPKPAPTPPGHAAVME